MQMRFNATQLIVAVIGAAGTIIGSLIVAYLAMTKTWSCTVEVKDIMGDPVQAKLWLTASGEKEVAMGLTDAQGSRLIQLKRGRNTVRVESDGYVEISMPIKNHQAFLPINLESTEPMRPKAFSLAGWSKWGNIQVSFPESNAVVINGTAGTAGYVSEDISRALAGKILMLSFSNTAASTYRSARLLKVEVNDDKLLWPLNEAVLIAGEYIAAGDRTVEYLIPENFTGRINMVFYRARLDNLRISAFYRNK
jgi:hypothetical protein